MVNRLRKERKIRLIIGFVSEEEGKLPWPLFSLFRAIKRISRTTLLMLLTDKTIRFTAMIEESRDSIRLTYLRIYHRSSNPRCLNVVRKFAESNFTIVINRRIEISRNDDTRDLLVRAIIEEAAFTFSFEQQLLDTSESADNTEADLNRSESQHSLIIIIIIVKVRFKFSNPFKIYSAEFASWFNRARVTRLRVKTFFSYEEKLE